MKNSLARLLKVLPDTQRGHIARFHKDESGSMIVFTLFIIVLMLIIGGMAVDFMRFESRRAMMQGAVDSAVLAAADLDQNLDAKAVVEDYVTKSQAGNCLSGEVKVDDSAVNFRSVTAKCELTMNTFFLKLIGMDQLTATAESTAVEGVGNIEVSLVVDISGSMRDPTVPGGETKISALRGAAGSFIDELLLPEFEDKISISLVPYSQHVNVGPALFDTLNVSEKHGWSHCVDMPASSYTQTAWSDAVALDHEPHVQTNGRRAGEGTVPENTICPRYSYERIIPVSQNKDALKGAINQFQPRAGTSIFMGLKWGVTLLDPTFNDNLEELPNGMIDDAFSDRPSAYPDPDARKSNDTFKYLVLMTDGMNDFTHRIRPELYDTPSEVAHWNTTNASEFMNNVVGSFTWANYEEYFVRNYYTPEDGDGYMQSMCTAARDKGIIIFGIGVYESVPDPEDAATVAAGETSLKACAGSINNYFRSDGTDLTAIFEAIAGQITDLRLTL